MDKDFLLTPHEKQKKQAFPLVIRFHPDLPKQKSVLHDHHCVGVINTSPCSKEALLTPPPQSLFTLQIRKIFGEGGLWPSK